MPDDHAIASDRQAHPKSRVLIIEDSAAIHRLVARALTWAGYDVCDTADGDDGLRQFVAWKPVLVITNIIMPGKDGIETIREIRQVVEVPILAISAGDQSYLEAAVSEPSARPAGSRLRREIRRPTSQSSTT